ncbi:hypothetical protein CBR_g23899 [Chara braunii]|uniref:Uncharacterized protein n=1 Tax=Chara braunii TaxID=69332 RepID=A0A388L561_CHABU|nr:hypothetical protein CBR_g23899 [Chara braunii]|eukprot:GBG77450.1 hypothetical protein CBR_g23899 [Chara braunii]
MEGRHAVRQLLRAIDQNITKVTGNRLWRERVIAMSRNSVSGEDSVTTANEEERVALAKDYAFLLNSVREHKELLSSYNVKADGREDLQLERAAARVGLKLPISSGEEEPSKS